MMRRCHSLLPGLALLLLLLVVAAGANRDGVFVGYKESGVAADGGGDGSLHAAGEAGGDGGGGGGGGGGGAVDGDATVDPYDASARGKADAAADAGGLEAAALQLGRTVVLYTQFGPIRVHLLEKLAPKATALVLGLAERRGCTGSACVFYRNEARPKPGEPATGPPYSLLQGRLDLPEVPPREGEVPVKMGHVCFIPNTKDFFIAYGDHPEWGQSHTVWGLVDEWFATDFTISQQFREDTHPEFGTKMRMLKQEVPIRIAVAGDTTYSGLLGPLA